MGQPEDQEGRGACLTSKQWGRREQCRHALDHVGACQPCKELRYHWRAIQNHQKYFTKWHSPIIFLKAHTQWLLYGTWMVLVVGRRRVRKDLLEGYYSKSRQQIMLTTKEEQGDTFLICFWVIPVRVLAMGCWCSTSATQLNEDLMKSCMGK